MIIEIDGPGGALVVARVGALEIFENELAGAAQLRVKGLGYRVKDLGLRFFLKAFGFSFLFPLLGALFDHALRLVRHPFQALACETVRFHSDSEYVEFRV